MLIEKKGKTCIIENILNFYLKKKNEIPINIHKDRQGFSQCYDFFPCNIGFKYL